MRLPKLSLFSFGLCFGAMLMFAGCQSANENANTTATTNATPPGTQNLSVIPRPQKIVDDMKARGDQDEAKPVLKIVTPAKGATVNGSTVDVKLALTGNLKGYMPHKAPSS